MKPIRLISTFFSPIVRVFFISAVLIGCTRIEAGYEGILVNDYGSDRGVQEASLVTGRVWYNPWTKSVYQFPVYVQTKDYDPFEVQAKDGSQFVVDPTISVSIIEGRSPYIFVKYRKQLDEIIDIHILNHVKDAFRIQFNKFTTDSLVSNRESIDNAIENQLAITLEKEGFKLEQITCAITYPESIVAAINKKNEMIQKAMEAENQLKVKEQNAKGLLVEAESQRKANELMQQSLTPLLMQKMFIEKWDGKTPLYGNTPVTMLMTPKFQ